MDDELAALQAELDQLNQEILTATLMVDPVEIQDVGIQTEQMVNNEVEVNTEFLIDFQSQVEYTFDPSLHSNQTIQVQIQQKSFNHGPSPVKYKPQAPKVTRNHSLYRTVDQKASPLLSVFTEQSPSSLLNQTLRANERKGLRGKPPPQNQSGQVSAVGKSIQW